MKAYKDRYTTNYLNFVLVRSILSRQTINQANIGPDGDCDFDRMEESDLEIIMGSSASAEDLNSSLEIDMLTNTGRPFEFRNLRMSPSPVFEQNMQSADSVADRGGDRNRLSLLIGNPVSSDTPHNCNNAQCSQSINNCQFRSLKRSILDVPCPAQSVENRPEMISNATQTSPMKLNTTKLEVFSIPPVTSALSRSVSWSNSEPEKGDEATCATNPKRLTKQKQNLEKELPFEEKTKNIMAQANHVN
jgi:hypothetical protein